jgi:hypothetical protein
VGDHPENIVEIPRALGRFDLGREVHAASGGNARLAERRILRPFPRRRSGGGSFCGHGAPSFGCSRRDCTRGGAVVSSPTCAGPGASGAATRLRQRGLRQRALTPSSLMMYRVSLA